MSTHQDEITALAGKLDTLFDENMRLPNDEDYKGPRQKVETTEDSPAEEEEATEETASAETDGEESKEDTNEEENEEPALVTVEIDGKSYEVPEELKASIMKSADYTRKTQALSEEKKQVEQHLNVLNAERQAVLQERTAYKQRLENLDAIIGQQLQQNTPNWERLRTENPTEYLIQRDIHNQIREHQAKIQADYQRVKAQEDQEMRAYHEKQVNANLIQLKSMDPRWQDPKVMEKDFRDVVDYVKNKMGASEQDIMNAQDPKVLRMAYLAMQHDRLVESTNNVKNKAIKGKTISAGTTVKPSSRSSLKKEIQSLGNKGSRLDDAAAVFGKILNI